MLLIRKYSSFDRYIPWFKVSNAFDRSTNTENGILFGSISILHLTFDNFLFDTIQSMVICQLLRGAYVELKHNRIGWFVVKRCVICWLREHWLT